LLLAVALGEVLLSPVAAMAAAAAAGEY